jgi:hypothetical protein
MNKIIVFTIAGLDDINKCRYTSNSIRFTSSPMSPCNLDINNGIDLPFGLYRILELNILIHVFNKHDNCYQFWTQ